jgi:Synaptobrevin
MGTWVIKGINGVTYLVVTSHNYPQDVAMECLDEFSEAYERVSKTWRTKRRVAAQVTCCQAIFDKYTSIEVETTPWFLMNSVDRDSRREYSRSVKNLFDKVSKLEKQMNDNILHELENMESVESLQELANDCFEKAAVFRKKAKEVKMHTKRRSHVFVASGVAACAVVGGVVGFLAGGPGGAIVLTTMSVAEAQAIEAAVAAVIFGAGYYVAQSQVDQWSWRQPIRIL